MNKNPAIPGPSNTGVGSGRPTVPFGHEDIPEAEKEGRVAAIFKDVAPKYDLMNDLMSFGTHRLWKAACIDWLIPRPAMRIADVGGGTADMAMRIANRACPKAMESAGGAVTVIDINDAMMNVGRQRTEAAGLQHLIRFSGGNAEALPLAAASVDAYVIAFGLRNVTHPELALAEARRVLAPGGRFLCLEFSKPRWPLLGPAYDGYSDHVLPKLGQMVAGKPDAYRYLAESIRRFPNQERLAAMVEAAGLERVQVRNLSGGIAAIHSAWRL
jgi:demethylmenaquinone methyltransferase/2-methoxy-6-polyprenyl-1,4-benzoquinol methylase